MKTNRFNQEYRRNASKLHKKIGETLKTSFFSNFTAYQEYPVNKINSNYGNASHKFDWVILDLHLVIEVHGAQHYKASTFGGISKEEAIENLSKQKFRDTRKLDAAIEAGFTYLEIPYNDINKIDADYIWKLYQENKNPDPIEKEEKEETEYEIKQKQRAKEYRQKQYENKKAFYEKLKEQRRNNNGSETKGYSG